MEKSKAWPDGHGIGIGRTRGVGSATCLPEAVVFGLGIRFHLETRREAEEQGVIEAWRADCDAQRSKKGRGVVAGSICIGSAPKQGQVQEKLGTLCRAGLRNRLHPREGHVV